MVNIGNMMKQAQQLQKKMADAQEKLNSIEVEGAIEECKVSLKPMYDPLNEKIRN